MVYCASSDSRMSKTQTTSILQYSNIILKWFNCSNYRHSPPIQLSLLIFFMISFCPKDPHNIILTWGCQTHQTSCKTLYLGMCFLRQKKWNETCTRDLLGNSSMKIVLFKSLSLSLRPMLFNSGPLKYFPWTHLEGAWMLHVSDISKKQW